jgi:hypothetical protein
MQLDIDDRGLINLTEEVFLIIPSGHNSRLMLNRLSVLMGLISNVSAENVIMWWHNRR